MVRVLQLFLFALDTTTWETTFFEGFYLFNYDGYQIQ